jgi:hypothetical protein
MKKAHLLLGLLALSCGQQASSPAPESKAPQVAYTVINNSNKNGSQFIDIFLRDTAAIKSLNDYLKDKYNKDHGSWIEINYFNDSLVAKTYFDKQLDQTISDRAKDKLFKHFIANYKYNPSTGYDTLAYEH